MWTGTTCAALITVGGHVEVAQMVGRRDARPASYSDMTIGLYKMLGFRFALRFRDLADQRLRRVDVAVPGGQLSTGGDGR
jgi:hypothetical protein